MLQTLKRVSTWPRRHRIRATLLLLLLGILLLNALAFIQARALTHYAAGGARTASPEQLTWLDKVGVLLTGPNVPRPENHTVPDLPFETHRWPINDQEHLEGWLIPHPRARATVVLFPGYASCKCNLLPEARLFHAMGCSVFLVDCRGCGGSSGSVTTIGYREAEDVCHAVDYLRQHGQQTIILFGQSMGSAAILRALTIRDLKPRAIILECPFDRLQSTVENRFQSMGLPAFPGAPLLLFWAGVQSGFDGFAHDPAEYARAVECPVLLLHGGQDARVTPSQAEEVFRNIPGEKYLHIFPTAGHQSYTGCDAATWKEVVQQFLDKVLQ